jgi:hypothetical protein
LRVTARRPEDDEAVCLCAGCQTLKDPDFSNPQCGLLLRQRRIANLPAGRQGRSPGLLLGLRPRMDLLSCDSHYLSLSEDSRIEKKKQTPSMRLCEEEAESRRRSSLQAGWLLHFDNSSSSYTQAVCFTTFANLPAGRQGRSLFE